MITVARLHKILGDLIQNGCARRPVCIDKTSFQHPLEGDGVTILYVIAAKTMAITIADDDGFAATNKDGSERMRRVVVLSGGHDADRRLTFKITGPGQR